MHAIRHFFSQVFSLLRFHWPVVFLVLLSLVLFATNYHPGTFLLGWDNTVPELNLPLNLSRILTSTWQEYRGLGTLDGMAHSANIIHWIYTALLSLILPLHMVRMVFLLLTHLLGGVGVYVVLVTTLIPAASKLLHRTPLSDQHNKLIGLLGATLYLFNLMTIQMFYIPLEVFAIHFAIIPWGFWSLSKYLSSPTKKNLLLFAVVQLLGISQAHVPSVFIAYALGIGLVLFGFLLQYKKAGVRTASSVIALLFAINAFWGVPYLYSAIHKAPEISASKINQFSTDDIFYRNKAWGQLGQVATFGGFNLDYEDWTLAGDTNQSLLQPYQQLYRNWAYQGATIGIFGIAGISALYFLWIGIKKRQYLLTSFAGTLLFFLSMLAIDTPGLGIVSASLRTYLPYFHDIFRFTFTKFSLMYVFFLSVFFALGVMLLLTAKWSQKLLSKVKKSVAILGCIGVTLTLAFPAFTGNFFYSELKVIVPTEYWQVVSFFKERPASDRIALLPLTTFYGWENNTWGHRGSGFMWQALPQPMLHRSFDAWSTTNETAYLQLQEAVATQDFESFLKLLEKYQIRWLLLDRSIFVPGNADQAKRATVATEQLIASNPTISHSATYGNLDIYAVELPSKESGLVTNQTIATVDPLYQSLKTTNDPAYKNLSNYITQNNGTSFPFANLSQEQITISPNNPSLHFEKTFSQPAHLQLPQNSPENYALTVTVKPTISGYSILLTPVLPEFTLDSNRIAALPIEFFIPANTTKGYFLRVDQAVFELPPTKNEITLGTVFTTNTTLQIELFSSLPLSFIEVTESLAQQQVSDCWKNTSLDWFVDKNDTEATLRSKNASACVALPIEIEQSDKASGSALFAVSYSAQSDGAEPAVCIRAIDSQTCLNQNTSTFSSLSQSEFSSFALLDSDTYAVEFINKITQLHTQQSTTFSSIFFSTFRKVGGGEISTQSNLSRYYAELSQMPRQSNRIEITYNLPLPKQGFSNIETKENLAPTINCGSSNGSVTRTKKSGSMLYTASNKAALCEKIELPTTTAQEEFFYFATGRVLSGGGLQGFFSNQNDQRVVEFTTGSKDFSFLTSVHFSKENSSLSLHYFMKSFGKDAYQVEIQQSAIIPAPISWLSAISIDQNQKEGIPADVLQHAKNGIFWHEITIATSQNETIANLSQSYDPAWIAFPSNRPWQLLDHRTYNGWANAWIVPAGTTAVTMLFWPQLLSFAGYGVLVVTLGWLAVATLRQRPNQPAKPTSYELHRFVIRRFAKLRARLLGR